MIARGIRSTATKTGYMVRLGEIMQGARENTVTGPIDPKGLQRRITEAKRATLLQAFVEQTFFSACLTKNSMTSRTKSGKKRMLSFPSSFCGSPFCAADRQRERQKNTTNDAKCISIPAFGRRLTGQHIHHISNSSSLHRHRIAVALGRQMQLKCESAKGDREGESSGSGNDCCCCCC